MKAILKYRSEFLVLAIFVLSRLPSLGHDNFTTDTWKWKARSYDFSTGVFTFQPAKTLQKYHPGVTLMWDGAFGVKIANLYFDSAQITDPLQQIFALDVVQKILVVLTIGATLSFIFYALRKMFGLRYAALAVTMLALEPFYVGLTRVFHLEGLLSTFMVAFAVWLYYFLQEPWKRSRLFVSAVFGALAILTKTSALYVFPFLLLGLFLFGPKTGRISFVIRKSAIWLGTAVIVAVILWPALWSIPSEVFTALYKGIVTVGVETEHIQYYFGNLVDDPGWTYYFVVYALRSSVFLFVGLVGLVFTFRKLASDKRRFAVYMLLFALFYFTELTLPTKKLDRYFLPSLLALSLSVSVFYESFLSRIKVKKYLKYGLFVIPMVAQLVFIHPDYFSYYNPLFGGLRTGINVLEPKWLIGTPEVVTYFKNVQQTQGYRHSGPTESFEEVINKKLTDQTLSVAFREKYYTQIFPFFREFGAWAVIGDLQDFAKASHYFVFPVWDQENRGITEFKLKFVGQIKVRGVAVYDVYQKVAQ
jgi:4-amino-4-deoxy-L-arabinose transferase-like glycosyltransferase